MDNLFEYLVEVTVKDENLTNVLSSLKKAGLKLDKTFKPKLLKVKVNNGESNNFLIKGRIQKNAITALSMNSNISNYWSNSGNIPFS